MTTKQYDIYKYDVPLEQALTIGKTRLSRREGFLVRLRDEAGAQGWGEVSPLPGFSQESLEQALDQLKGAAADLVGQPLDVDSVLGGDRVPAQYAPSVRFGLETACLALLEASEGVSWWENGGLHGEHALGICRLLRPDAPDQDLAAAEGFPSFKLKVGRGGLDAEIETVRDLAAALPQGATLRLDANRAWRVADAHAFCASITDLPVEYVEEPLADPAGWGSFAEGCEVPTAIDESLLATGVEILVKPGGPYWVVLKPTLVGGLSGAMRLARFARSTGRQVVVSSMYETGVGFRAVTRLAATLQDPGVAAGLDTLRALAEDVVEEAVPLEGGELLVGRMEASGMTVCMEKLERVTGG